MSEPRISILDHVVGCDLAAVIFIKDYLQLQFEKAYKGTVHLSAFNWPVLRIAEPSSDGSGSSFDVNSCGYRDALCCQIDKIVIAAFEKPEEAIIVRFSDLSELIFSLKESDRRGPEAVMLHAEGGKVLEVW